jgi:hypothetical protein
MKISERERDIGESAKRAIMDRLALLGLSGRDHETLAKVTVATNAAFWLIIQVADNPEKMLAGVGAVLHELADMCDKPM